MNGPVSWTDRVNAYLAYRRSVGFSLLPESLYLPQFARFAEQQHAPRFTVQLAMDWACTAQRPTPMRRAYRLLRLRGFAKYGQTFDPDTEMPPLGLFGRTHRRLVPHIYTQQELAELLEATSELHPRDGLRPLTYQVLYGLLACCGLRIGEAIRLTRTDVDLDGGVLSIRNTKRHKSRFVPLHASTVRALAAYRQERDRRALWPPSDHFFLLDNGQPPRRPRLCDALHRLADELGWTPRGDYPHHRLQDFRHTFIVRSLLRAFEAGLEMDRMVLALSTYVGHDHVTDTYWYVTGVPELMALAGERFRNYSQVVTL